MRQLVQPAPLRQRKRAAEKSFLQHANLARIETIEAADRLHPLLGAGMVFCGCSECFYHMCHCHPLSCFCQLMDRATRAPIRVVTVSRRTFSVRRCGVPPPGTRPAACTLRCALGCQGVNYNVLAPRRTSVIRNFDRNLSPPRQFYTMAARPPENSLKAAPEVSERRLIAAAQQDPRRFAALYEIHFERVYAYVSRRLGNREAAEDVTSEVFQHALANLPRFEWRGAPFGAWLMRIASNAIADRWRRGAREQSHEFASDPASVEPSPEEIEIRAQLFRRVQGLPIEQRKVLRMRFAEEKSIREIAQALGRSEGAIKQLQFRAVQNLRDGFDAVKTDKPQTTPIDGSKGKRAATKRPKKSGESNG